MVTRAEIKAAACPDKESEVWLETCQTMGGITVINTQRDSNHFSIAEKHSLAFLLAEDNVCATPAAVSDGEFVAR